MTVTVEHRTVYGNEMFYPIGEGAEHVQQLTGKKTVDVLDLRALQALGIEIDEKMRERNCIVPWIDTARAPFLRISSPPKVTI